MQKLRYEVIEKMMKSSITSTEIDFIIYVSRYQNDSGLAKGIYYKDMCQELGISNQTFYDLKTSLSEKGIICAEKNNYYDWDIKILNNDFSNASYKNGKDKYINTNHRIFYEKDFYAMKANEKFLVFEFMKICLSGAGSHDIGTKKFYEKYTAVLGIKKRMLQGYIKNLRQFFSIGIKDKKFWITPLAKVYRNLGAPSESENYRNHIGDMICRRGRIKDVAENVKKDTVNLLSQYSNTAPQDKLENFLFVAVQKSIEKANAGISNIYKWIRKLQPKLVHRCLREQLENQAV